MNKSKTNKVKKWKYSRKECLDKLEMMPESYPFKDFCKDLLDTQPQPVKEELEGKFAPNGGHDPNNPFPLKQEDNKECKYCGSKTLKHKNYCYLHHPFENEEGIDWSKKDIYDGIKRPDLRPNLSSEKECRHKWSIDFDINCKYCEICGKEISIKTPTPSPLDDFKKIEEIKLQFFSKENELEALGYLLNEATGKINCLIYNQNKLISLTKRNIK